jgi:L-amino acid N-acyltransferase YncA
MIIRNVIPDDAHAICAIYNHYVENTVISFEEKPVSENEMKRRIREIVRSLPWLVAEEDGRVLGYAYASPWKNRGAYRYAVESTVYLAPDAAGRGIGRRLCRELISALGRRHVHAVMACIALPNPASIGLHEKLGFERVAHFKQIGWKFDRWIDVGYWQLVLERDS